MQISLFPTRGGGHTDTVTCPEQLCGSHQDQMARWRKDFSRRRFKRYSILFFFAGRWDYFHMAAVQVIPSFFNSYDSTSVFYFHFISLVSLWNTWADPVCDQAADGPSVSQRRKGTLQRKIRCWRFTGQSRRRAEDSVTFVFTFLNPFIISK